MLFPKWNKMIQPPVYYIGYDAISIKHLSTRIFLQQSTENTISWRFLASEKASDFYNCHPLEPSVCALRNFAYLGFLCKSFRSCLMYNSLLKWNHRVKKMHVETIFRILVTHIVFVEPFCYHVCATQLVRHSIACAVILSNSAMIWTRYSQCVRGRVRTLYHLTIIMSL